MTLNVLNPKSLEKQIKIVDARLSELAVELEELEKIKAACQILLGKPTEVKGAAAKKKQGESDESEPTPENEPPTSEAETAAPLN